MNLQVFKDKIRDIIQLDKGGSYNLAIKLVFYTRLFRYVKRDQYKKIDSKFSVISSKDRLQKFVDIGVLEQSNDIYKATEESTELIIDDGFNKLLLPKIVSGFGNINAINNTEVLIQTKFLSDYRHLCYPNFEYVIPDALLIRQQENKIKFQFLEIEAKKPKWEDYLLRKKKNYIKLSKDIRVFNYCLKVCEHLGLTKIKIETFKFSVVFISEIKEDFGNGFMFVNKLEDI